MKMSLNVRHKLVALEFPADVLPVTVGWVGFFFARRSYPELVDDGWMLLFYGEDEDPFHNQGNFGAWVYGEDAKDVANLIKAQGIKCCPECSCK